VDERRQQRHRIRQPAERADEGETNPIAASASRGVLTDYSSGDRGARLSPAQVQIEALRFLTDLDLVFPGAFSAATQIKNRFIAHLEAWPSNPLSMGSYTCYRRSRNAAANSSTIRTRRCCGTRRN
jgi:hypothetical protein